MPLKLDFVNTFVKTQGKKFAIMFDKFVGFKFLQDFFPCVCLGLKSNQTFVEHQQLFFQLV